MKYTIEVTFHGSQIIELDAVNADAARRFVDNMVTDRDLLAEDLDNTEWIVGEAKAADDTDHG